jgi:hypothetical protein
MKQISHLVNPIKVLNNLGEEFVFFNIKFVRAGKIKFNLS